MKPGTRASLFRSVVLAITGICGFSNTFAAVDVTKLPPPAAKQVEFTRDILPILEKSCFRCHGPERPKGRFRLDNKEMALRGGENGVDIIPGNSEKSPLIHFVAGLDEE